MSFIINSINAYVVPPVKTTPKFVAESEIKHGRVAMVSSLLIPFLDNVKPDVLGVNYVNSLDIGTQQLLLFGFGFSEFCQLLNGYEFPNNTSQWFRMKEDHVPGDYGFDPFEFNKYNNSNSLKTNELFVGRVAMVAVACQMANELLVGEPVLKF
tara:strand:- start:1965 stop:2426 length:462 start_codon:yes stop_codon:yes gene_type:complete